MLLRLRLLEFRCHERLEFFPTPGRNHLVGQNGRGKTSILEAAWFLSRLRSFRTGQPREMARWPGKGFAIEADCAATAGGPAEHLIVRWNDGARETFLDGNKIAMPEFWGRLPTVLLSAEDTVLIRGPAARRQAWLDALESLAVPAHLVAVQRYNAVLKQRNAWLREWAGGRRGDRALGEVLDAQLVATGLAVTAGRVRAAEAAGRLAEPLLEAFFGGAAVCRFAYRPGFDPAGGEEAARTLLREAAPSEQRQGRTLAGPHRDEWIIQWKGKSVGRFGSEGEQRLSALLLRLIEAARVREARGRWPLFLLDDALTPLDPERKLTLEQLLPADAQILQAGTVMPDGGAVWEIGPGSCLLPAIP
ncbi:DNA replication and repair protein RecF [Verrucomicrobium sp. GAS474]|uniref:DNA replication/repair protein RecF n=1 Tax=Verrucomicrobium sp. GAS474 TaxID=1882831 RepID=UPI00087BB5EC|nr:DNA replication and repair protein RecF [Verrucomicrobium sp. GAS474]SDT98414.1 DNA replication and repair protein RecF [Verrucomicrobium sp. GAS474]